MPYAAPEDLNLSTQRLVELTEHEDAIGEIDGELLTLLLNESETLVNSILATAPSLAVPFEEDAVPLLVKTCTAWIWAYRLYRHREVMEIPQSIKDDYIKALDMLQKIVDGELDAGGGTDAGGSGTVTNVPSVASDRNRGWSPC